MNTLLLDTVMWDLVVDLDGNIAMASNPYAIAQDVASAIKLFVGELEYDTTKGVPYFEQILGLNPPASLIRAELMKAALTVPEVVKARVVSLGMTNRVLSGIIEIIDRDGQKSSVNF